MANPYIPTTLGPLGKKLRQQALLGQILDYDSGSAYDTVDPRIAKLEESTTSQLADLDRQIAEIQTQKVPETRQTPYTTGGLKLPPVGTDLYEGGDAGGTTGTPGQGSVIGSNQGPDTSVMGTQADTSLTGPAHAGGKGLTNAQAMNEVLGVGMSMYSGKGILGIPGLALGMAKGGYNLGQISPQHDINIDPALAPALGPHDFTYDDLPGELSYMDAPAPSYAYSAPEGANVYGETAYDVGPSSSASPYGSGYAGGGWMDMGGEVASPGSVDTSEADAAAMGLGSLGSDGGECFLEGRSFVRTPYGDKPIEKVIVGDYVLNHDCTALNKVLFIERWEVDRKQRFYSPSQDVQPFATLNHPIYFGKDLFAVNNEVYKWLGMVREAENSYIEVLSEGKKHNLWVDGDGTYIVNGFGVHSIMFDGGFLRKAYERAALTYPQVIELLDSYGVSAMSLRDFSGKGLDIRHGAYLLNKFVGKLDFIPSLTRLIADIMISESGSLKKLANPVMRFTSICLSPINYIKRKHDELLLRFLNAVGD